MPPVSINHASSSQLAAAHSPTAGSPSRHGETARWAVTAPSSHTLPGGRPGTARQGSPPLSPRRGALANATGALFSSATPLAAHPPWRATSLMPASASPTGSGRQQSRPHSAPVLSSHDPRWGGSGGHAPLVRAIFVVSDVSARGFLSSCKICNVAIQAHTVSAGQTLVRPQPEAV